MSTKMQIKLANALDKYLIDSKNLADWFNFFKNLNQPDKFLESMRYTMKQHANKIPTLYGDIFHPDAFEKVLSFFPTEQDAPKVISLGSGPVNQWDTCFEIIMSKLKLCNLVADVTCVDLITDSVFYKPEQYDMNHKNINYIDSNAINYLKTSEESLLKEKNLIFYFSWTEHSKSTPWAEQAFHLIYTTWSKRYKEDPESKWIILFTGCHDEASSYEEFRELFYNANGVNSISCRPGINGGTAMIELWNEKTLPDELQSNYEEKNDYDDDNYEYDDNGCGDGETLGPFEIKFKKAFICAENNNVINDFLKYYEKTIDENGQEQFLNDFEKACNENTLNTFFSS